MTTRDAQPLTVRASFQPSTVDADARTVELVWTTGADVLRYDFHSGESYVERLIVDESSVDMSRLHKGAPVLAAHSSMALEDVIGVVERAWIADGEGRAVVKFSRRESVEPVWRDVVDGVLRNVSVGYSPDRTELTDIEVDGVPVRKVTRWTPHEISIVPIPADPGSQVRSEDKQRPAREAASKGLSMERDQEIRAEEEEQRETPEEEEERAVDEEEEERAVDEEEEEEREPEKEDEDKRAAVARLAERRRASSILIATRKAKLPDTMAQKLIDKGISVDKARAKIIDALAERDNQEISTVTAPSTGARDGAFRAAVAGGILHRSAVTRTDDRDALTYSTMSLLRIGEECLARAGKQTRGLPPQTLAKRALMETADFGPIVALVAARTLRAGYDMEPRTFQGVFRQAADVMNFQNIRRVKLSDAPELPLVAEGATYTEGALSDSQESYVLAKYGRILSFTWEMMINDDLNALARVPQLLGTAAARRESDVVWGRLTGNPVLSDTFALFHASRDNLVDDVLNAAGLENGRKYFRTRTAENGSRVNLMPRFLIVGPELESQAEKLLNENLLIAGQRADIVAGSLRTLSLVVEPRIEGTDWYLAAAPNSVDTIEYAYLAGENGVHLETDRTFDVDDLRFKARLVVGAGAIDPIGLYKSTGDAVEAE